MVELHVSRARAVRRANRALAWRLSARPAARPLHRGALGAAGGDVPDGAWIPPGRPARARLVPPHLPAELRGDELGNPAAARKLLRRAQSPAERPARPRPALVKKRKAPATCGLLPGL